MNVVNNIIYRLKVWFHRHYILKDQVELQDYVIGQIKDENKALRRLIEECYSFTAEQLQKFKTSVHEGMEETYQIEYAHRCTMTNDLSKIQEQLPSMKSRITTQKTAIDQIRNKREKYYDQLEELRKVFSEMGEYHDHNTKLTIEKFEKLQKIVDRINKEVPVLKDIKDRIWKFEAHVLDLIKKS